VKPSPTDTSIHPDTPSTFDEGQCVMWLAYHGEPVPHTKPGLKPKHYLKLLRSWVARRMIEQKTERLMRLLPRDTDENQIREATARGVYAIVCPVCQCRVPTDQECECGSTYRTIKEQIGGA
jgi:hypothetical protein